MNGSFRTRRGRSEEDGDEAVSPKNRCSVRTGSATGSRKGLSGRRGSGSLRPQARHLTSLRDTPPHPRSLSSQIPSSPGAWSTLSPGLQETPPLPPSWPSCSRAAPTSLCEPTTWRPGPLARRPARAASPEGAREPGAGCSGEVRAPSLPFLGLTGLQTRPCFHAQARFSARSGNLGTWAAFPPHAPVSDWGGGSAPSPERRTSRDKPVRPGRGKNVFPCS